MEKTTNKTTLASKLTSFTVKQLSELFGKSEDTIRRWKNEGVGKGEDNVKLQAVEKEDASGRRNSRHLVFTKSAVRDFVQANPYLMDNAPQLREFMEERSKKPRVFALPDSIESARGKTAWQDIDDSADEDDAFLHRFTRCVEEEMDCDGDGSIFDRVKSRMAEDDDSDEDPFLRFTRAYKPGTWDEDEEGNPFISHEHVPDEADEEADEEDSYTPPRYRRASHRRSYAPEEEESAYDEASIRYMLCLLREREQRYRMELRSNRQAGGVMLRRELADILPDGGMYISDLIREREEELERELETLRETTRALEELLY